MMKRIVLFLVFAFLFLGFSSSVNSQIMLPTDSQRISDQMDAINYAIYSAHSYTPKKFEAQNAQDIVPAYLSHDWEAEMIEMKRRFDANEQYSLPQFTIGRDEAYMIIEPGYDGTATVSAHKFIAYEDIHIYGEQFSKPKVIEAIKRFLDRDIEWLKENLK